jgi:prevent-host-death family protein
MPTITATDANRRFSKMLADARKGRSTDVTVRGKPVARLVPLLASDTKREAAFRKHLENLRNRPVMNLPRVTRDEMYDDE